MARVVLAVPPQKYFERGQPASKTRVTIRFVWDSPRRVFSPHDLNPVTILLVVFSAGRSVVTSERANRSRTQRGDPMKLLVLGDAGAQPATR
jgi:hypothetical protein